MRPSDLKLTKFFAFSQIHLKMELKSTKNAFQHSAICLRKETVYGAIKPVYVTTRLSLKGRLYKRTRAKRDKVEKKQRENVQKTTAIIALNCLEHFFMR